MVQAFTSSDPAVKKYSRCRALNPLVMIFSRALQHNKMVNNTDYSEATAGDKVCRQLDNLVVPFSLSNASLSSALRSMSSGSKAALQGIITPRGSF